MSKLDKLKMDGMVDLMHYDPLSTAMQLKISLKGVRPPIWRRVLVPAYINLYQLHRVIQTVMGWEDYHLYEFMTPSGRFGEPDPDGEFLMGERTYKAARYRLYQVVDEGRERDRITYVYDFGDHWEHQVVLEKLLPMEEGTRYPVCLKGKRAAPPEDCGGLGGYYELLEAMADRSHPRRGELIEWLGGSFEPERFDLEGVNAELAAIRPRRPKRIEAGPQTVGLPAPGPQPPGAAKGHLERTLGKISRLVEDKEFASLDEANRFIQEALGLDGQNESAGDSPADQAQDLVYRAWETPSDAERTCLAGEALALDAGCADAYALLAEAAPTAEEALRLLEQGVQAAEERLGSEAFERDQGHFWGLLRTRPYMRVRSDLAHLLWAIGERDRAIAHGQDLLRLNENDNLGLRYELVNWLLAEGRTEDAGALLERFDDDPTCPYLFPRALWCFQRDGAEPESRLALLCALEANPNLMEEILRIDETIDDPPPDSYAVGSSEEARLAVHLGLEAWSKTQGALDWLFSTLQSLVEPSLRRTGRKIGRNEPCPCGSGRKYKHCCL